MRRHLREYAKASFGVGKKSKKIAINTEESGPDLGLATGDLDIRTLDLGEQFLSLCLSHIILLC
jgi:hypothetical protein